MSFKASNKEGYLEVYVFMCVYVLNVCLCGMYESICMYVCVYRPVHVYVCMDMFMHVFI